MHRPALPPKAASGPAAPLAAGGSQRWHYLDQLRALLMLAGIPYHAGLVYASHATWIVASQDTIEPVTWLIQFSHTFRMPVFFLLAGLFGMLMLRRRGASAWWQERLRRIGVPLATSLVLVSPFLVAASAFSQGGGESVLPALLREIRNPSANWTVHLWFLIYLLIYASGLAALWRFRRALRLEQAVAALQDSIERRPALGWLLLLGSGLATLAVAVAAKLLDSSYMLGAIFVPADFAANGLVFLCGALLAFRPGWLEGFTRPRWSIWGLALLSATAMAFTQNAEGDLARAATYLLMPIVGVLFAHLLFSAARRWLDRSTALSRAMVDAAMTMYLVHVAFVLWLSVAFLQVSWPPLAEFLLITLLSGLASYALHRAFRHSPLLTFLFNGTKPPGHRGSMASAPLPSSNRVRP